MIKKISSYFGFLLFLCASLQVFASQTEDTLQIPNAVSQKIQLQIQKLMSYKAQSETTAVLWTPHIISLQRFDAMALPMLDPFAPNQINYTLTYDVGMGHNMESDSIYWRQCDVSISSIDNVWGEPLVDCDLRKNL